MLFHIRVTLRDCRAQAGQSMAEYLLILAPFSAMIALAVGTLVLASSK
jgi:hypothetical protein